MDIWDKIMQFISVMLMVVLCLVILYLGVVVWWSTVSLIRKVVISATCVIGIISIARLIICWIKEDLA